MLKIDETELIEFFGVLPTKQDAEEKEFFGTSIFDVKKDNLHLSISFSRYFSDMILHLYVISSKKPVVEMSLKKIHELDIIRDKPQAIPFLRISGKINSDSCDAPKFFQTIKITVDPRICIQIGSD